MNLRGLFAHIGGAVSLVACGLRGDAGVTLRGMFDFACGYRVRGRNAIVGAASSSPAYYRRWIRRSEPQLLAKAPPLIAGEIPVSRLVVWLCDGSSAQDTPSVASVRAAFEPEIAITVIAEADRTQAIASLRDALSHLPERVWLLPLRGSDRIANSAAQHIVAALAAHPLADVVYWDEDVLDGGARSRPWLKPDWDELVFLAADGLTGASLICADRSLEALRNLPASGGFSDLADEFLAKVAQQVSHATCLHVPLILTHRLSREVPTDRVSERKTALLREWPGLEDLVVVEGPQGGLRPVFPLPTPAPAVSIIIPTRDRIDLLQVCIAGVNRTEYAGEIEVIVVDNDSEFPETRQYLAALAANGVTVLRHRGRFNFSAINNLAVQAARGDFVCLLNNDIELPEPGWLTALMRHAVRPDCGAAGALLLYPDGTVQHAGVAVGVGQAAGHVHRHVDKNVEGFRWMHRTTRHVSAVTAACLLVSRENYLAVGGMDDACFRVAFNDVDFCLKLARAGLRNVFVAEAVLIHHESKTRGSDFDPANRARFRAELAALQSRWHTESVIDPYQHPLLLRSSERAVLAP
ncbi:MAG: glycosyltransferase [Sphingomonadales bacterium]|nr:glycosyltransferase [Sphingomonadales bacterium]